MNTRLLRWGCIWRCAALAALRAALWKLLDVKVVDRENHTNSAALGGKPGRYRLRRVTLCDTQRARRETSPSKASAGRPLSR